MNEIKNNTDRIYTLLETQDYNSATKIIASSLVNRGVGVKVERPDLSVSDKEEFDNSTILLDKTNLSISIHPKGELFKNPNEYSVILGGIVSGFGGSKVDKRNLNALR